MNQSNNQENNTEIEFPIRLNRYLFLKGYCSRRKADEYIEQGLIKVNGKSGPMNRKLEKDDVVEINKKLKQLPDTYQYFLYNKPVGIVSHNPNEGEQSVEDVFESGTTIHPVGRLDKASQGLMFLTNDGRIVDRMLNPEYDHEKEYVVRVDKKLQGNFKTKMERGVNIEGYITAPCKINPVTEQTFHIVLTEGKKHQIRRMCAALGYQVKSLKRIRIMNLKIGKLPIGEGRKLTEKEKDTLFGKIGLT